MKLNKFLYNLKLYVNKIVYNSHTKYEEDTNMKKEQKINCTVSSCKYNNNDNKECELQQITVTPVKKCNSKKADESKCGSYESMN